MNPTVLQITSGERPAYPYSSHVFTAVKTGITIAQLNAGLTLIEAGHQKRLRVVNFFLQVNTDDVAALTDVRIGTTEGTPVVIATILQAVLLTGAKFSPTLGMKADGSAVYVVSLGAGWLAKLTKGAGVKIYKTGSSATGTATLDLMVQYEVCE